MYECYKNSYIQCAVSDINYHIINRSVEAACNNESIQLFDCLPPLGHLPSHQPCIIPNKQIDLTRRPVAFGRWAMPLLRRALHSEHESKVHKAIASISDLVHNPERGFEAIELDVHKRMVDLISHENESIREYTLMAFNSLANLGVGKMAMVTNNDILNAFKGAINDDVTVIRLKAATCLKILAGAWHAADYLIEYGYIPIILNKIQEEKQGEILEVHLETFKFLLYMEGKCIALKLGAFKILIAMVLEACEFGIVAKMLDILMLLSFTVKGKEEARKYNLLPILNRLLHNDNFEVCKAAACGIMFATINSYAKHAASKIKQLPKRLIQLARNTLNPTLQMFCIRALTNMCEHPHVREIVKTDYIEDILQIQMSMNPEYKKILLKVIYPPKIWEPEEDY